MYQKKNPETDLCPFEYALSFLKGKWDIRVLCLLAHNHRMRYGQFKHFLPEISDTVLSSVLKKMTDHLIIEKEVSDELPPRVEYTLSEKGGSMVPILQSLCRWSSEYHRDGQEVKKCNECKYGVSRTG